MTERTLVQLALVVSLPECRYESIQRPPPLKFTPAIQRLFEIDGGVCRLALCCLDHIRHSPCDDCGPHYHRGQHRHGDGSDRLYRHQPAALRPGLLPRRRPAIVHFSSRPPSQSQPEATYKPLASHLLARCLGYAFVFSSCFLRILFVFSWCFLGIHPLGTQRNFGGSPRSPSAYSRHSASSFLTASWPAAARSNMPRFQLYTQTNRQP